MNEEKYQLHLEKNIQIIHLPCGSTAYMADTDYGYTCEGCGCVVGSIGEPKECVEARNRYQVLEALGSKQKWDYNNGKDITE